MTSEGRQVDVTAWLRDLGLEEYDRAFRENAIDADVVRSLTAGDLREIGVIPVGHRRKLLDAITALRDGAHLKAAFPQFPDAALPTSPAP